MKAKKIASIVLLSGCLLSLSACGNEQKEKDMQSTIDSQSKQIDSLKKEKSKVEEAKKKADEKLKKADDSNAQKDKEIDSLKKVLASKKESNRLKQQTASTQSSQPKNQNNKTNTPPAQPSQASKQAPTNNGTPKFANEAEAEAYYDSLVDHDARVKKAEEEGNKPALTQDGEKVYNEDGSVLTNKQREQAQIDGKGDPVAQAETAKLQHEWAVKQGWE